MTEAVNERRLIEEWVVEEKLVRISRAFLILKVLRKDVWWNKGSLSFVGVFTINLWITNVEFKGKMLWLVLLMSSQ